MFPKSGPLIFCGNHRTYLDPPLIVVTAGPIGIVGPAKPFSKNAIIYGKPIDLAEHNFLEKGSEDAASELLKSEIIKLSETNI